jgi:hypothetical protein
MVRKLIPNSFAINLLGFPQPTHRNTSRFRLESSLSHGVARNRPLGIPASAPYQGSGGFHAAVSLGTQSADGKAEVMSIAQAVPHDNVHTQRTTSVLVNEGVHFLSWRSSSAWAK